MKVSELIEILKKQPQDLDVIMPLYSEFTLLEDKDVKVESHCEPREDGWVACKRPDKPNKQYVVIGL